MNFDQDANKQGNKSQSPGLASASQAGPTAVGGTPGDSGLIQDTFNQKSQSLRKQMQMMNDRLFETDRLLSMQYLYR